MHTVYGVALPKVYILVHFWQRLVVSERTRMSVKANRSEIYVIHKSRRQNAQGWAGNKSETSFGTKLVLYRCTWTYIGREVHGGTLLNKLFSKVLELRPKKLEFLENFR